MAADDTLPPARVPWDPAYDVGHPLIDTQHRALIDQCNRLADLCLADEAAFDAAFAHPEGRCAGALRGRIGAARQP